MSRIELTINVVDDDEQAVTMDCCSPAEATTTDAEEPTATCSCACC